MFILKLPFAVGFLIAILTGVAFTSILKLPVLAGFILTLVPYLTVELTKFRFFLINCYAYMVGITFYGIILLNNPFMNGLVAPTPYEMIYHEMIEGF